MRVVEYDVLKAALVSWAVTHVMDKLISICSVVKKQTWENAMKLVTLVVALVEMLAVYAICSAVIVVGACLEWLAHVARAAGMSSFYLRYKFTPTRGLCLYGQPLRQLIMLQSVEIGKRRFCCLGE